jgi:uncharacterized protein YndB with AHSA1/START domain
MTVITVEERVSAKVDKTWQCFVEPGHITQWNFASPDWICPKAENDLRPGGKFNYRMEAADGSIGFDFEGVFDEVIPHKLLSYTMGDGRKASVEFITGDNETRVVETFEAEETNSVEMQKTGWQAILNNFKKHVESA